MNHKVLEAVAGKSFQKFPENHRKVPVPGCLFKDVEAVEDCF